MPIPDSIVLTRFSDSSSRTFIPVLSDGGGSKRIDSETTRAEPSTLAFKQATQRPKGGVAVDRTLVQKSNTVLDSGNVPQTSVVNITIQRPQSPAITKAMMIDEIRLATDAAIAYVDDLLLGAV
jgi:hypothetical protein